MTADRVAYRFDEAGEAIGMSEKTIRRAVADGELPVHYARGMPRILRADLEAWIAAAPTERPVSA